MTDKDEGHALASARSSSPGLQRVSARQRRWRRARIGVLVLVAALVLAWHPATAHLRAASLLVRFADPSGEQALGSYGQRAVRDEALTFATAGGSARARIYVPDEGAAAPCVVVVHGVHRLGVDEPRLARFSRAIAASGVNVLTPDVRELADYRIDPSSIETIGESVRTLSARCHGHAVGLMGMSFAGGLALLAAADPRYAERVSFVASVGGHHDMARVARFFAGDPALRPDGTAEHLAAHPYGALVLVYAHVSRFFAPEDEAAARDALRLWLWEQKAEAVARAEALSPDGRARIDALFAGRTGEVRDLLLQDVTESAAAMARVSPRANLGGLRCPVFLLHGAGDTVIPPSETLWLAAEVPAGRLAQVLVTPVIEHVEMRGEPALLEQWALVRFMTALLDRAGGG
jgi:dienelactone hydrolase